MTLWFVIVTTVSSKGYDVTKRIIIALFLMAPVPVLAQTPPPGARPLRVVPPAGGCPGEPVPFYRCATEKAKTYSAPRTPFGHPDLQGYWAHGRQNYDLEDHPETFDARQETTAIVDPPTGRFRICRGPTRSGWTFAPTSRSRRRSNT